MINSLVIPDLLAQGIVPGADIAENINLENLPQGLNLENIFVYTPLKQQLISHLLTIGASAQAVGLVYFLTTRQNSAPRYRPASTLSAVVMVSAFLILGWQLIQWVSSFTFNGEFWIPTGAANFSNGYRYLNWSIDVPCLLTQMLFVLNVTPGQFRKTRNRFIIAGLLMIYTGYIGQYFQLTSLGWYLFWGAVSTVFFVYLLYLVGNLIFRNREGLPRPAYKIMGVIFWLILIAWTLYPLAYGVPLVWRFYSDWGSWAAVMRQFLYTVADISSKVIYGILITTIAQIRSAEEGYEPATRVLVGQRNSSVQETPDYIERR